MLSWVVYKSKFYKFNRVFFNLAIDYEIYIVSIN